MTANRIGIIIAIIFVYLLFKWYHSFSYDFIFRIIHNIILHVFLFSEILRYGQHIQKQQENKRINTYQKKQMEDPIEILIHFFQVIDGICRQSIEKNTDHA